MKTKVVTIDREHMDCSSVPWKLLWNRTAFFCAFLSNEKRRVTVVVDGAINQISLFDFDMFSVTPYVAQSFVLCKKGRYFFWKYCNYGKIWYNVCEESVKGLSLFFVGVIHVGAVDRLHLENHNQKVAQSKGSLV